MDYKAIGAKAADDKLKKVTEHAQGAAQKVGEVMTAMGEKVQPYLPDLSRVYLEPISPTPSRSLSERYHLIMESARPWKEFLNLSEFNIPPFSQMKSRLGHNIETYFYNYLIITVFHIIIFAFFHIGPVIALALYGGLLYVLFVAYPDEIQITQQICLNDTEKKIIAGLGALLVIFFGGFFTIFMSVVVFVTILVLVHGLFRDDEDYVEITSSA